MKKTIKLKTAAIKPKTSQKKFRLYISFQRRFIISLFFFTILFFCHTARPPVDSAESQDNLMAYFIYNGTLLISSGAAHAAPLAAPECRSVSTGSLQYLKHYVPVKFNAQIGAYYYWRVLFSDISTEEFYTRDTALHQFTLKSMPAGGIGYKAILQRRLYTWENWKNYYEDPTQYAIDNYTPVISVMEPSNGVVSNNPLLRFEWRAYDEETGLHDTPYTFMLLSASQKPIYNSGWTADTSYVPSEPLTPGTYLWCINVRDNDNNIIHSRVYNFSINSSEPPVVKRFEARSADAVNGYTSEEKLIVDIEGTDNIGITHYYISEKIDPPELNDSKWISTGNKTMFYSASVPFKINFDKDRLNADNKFLYPHKIYLWLKDIENNVSEMKIYIVYVDTIAPYNNSIIINNNAQFTLERKVKLKLDSNDNSAVTGYYIKECAGAPGAPEPRDPGWIINRSFEILKLNEFDFTLSEETGKKTIYVWYRDDAANISLAAASSILYDTKPPISPIIGSIGPANGQNGSSSTNITFLLKAEGSYNNQITSYYIKEIKNDGAAPALQDPGWKLFSAPAVKAEAEAPFVLSPQDDTKEIYAWFKDSYDNISEACKCLIVLDRQAPSGSVSFINPAAWQNKKHLNINISASDTIGVCAYLCSIYCYNKEDLTGEKNLWRNITPQKSLSISETIDAGDTNGERKIFAWFKDAAGNISTPSILSFKLDNRPPVFGKLKSVAKKIAGSQTGYLDGPVETAQFELVDTVYANSKDEIYVADYRNRRIRKIKDGFVTSFAGCGKSDRNIYGEYAIIHPSGIAEDDYGYFYITDGHISKKVYPDGTITRYAGYDFRNPLNPYSHGGDDPVLDTRHISRAEFKQTSGICMDRYGNAYISDVTHIRKIRNEIVSVYAGNPDGAAEDGAALQTKIINAGDITVDSAGTIYFPDAGFNVIKKITTDGICKTIAGKAGTPDNIDGPAGINRLNNPTSIITDKYGVIYITDFKNYKIYKLTPDGFLASIVPDPSGLSFSVPQSLTFLSTGELVYGEQNRDTVNKITFNYIDGLRQAENNPRNGNTFNFIITASDDYSGINAFYISDAAEPPAPYSGWKTLNYTGGIETFEVSFTPGDAKKLQKIYVWLKDSAGNISNPECISVNKKNMAIDDSLGGSGILNSPSAVACDRYGSVYAADLSANPIIKFSLDKTYHKFMESGFTKEKLGVINSIVTFYDGFIGIIEKEKLRFSFIDSNYKIINYICQSVDFSLNYNDSQTLMTGELTEKFHDKFSSAADNRQFAFNYGYNFTFNYQPDFYFAAHKLEIYEDANFTRKINGPVSSYKYPVLYIKVTGSGSESKKINSIIAKVTTTVDTKGHSIQLIETGEETNVFTGILKIGKYSSVTEPCAGIEIDQKIYLTFYSRSNVKTFTLNIAGQWIQLGENQASDASASYLSIKNHNGITYAAYNDEQRDNKLSVIKCENNHWSFVGEPGFSRGAAREIQLEIYNSNPCVLYSDASQEFKITVMNFDGNQWKPLGAENFSSPNASFISFCTAGNAVYTAYSDWLFGSRPKIMRYEPQTGWNAFNGQGLVEAVCDFNNICAAGETLYFLTRDNYTAGFLLYKFVENEWIELSDGPMQKTCHLLKLKVFNSTPYVLYAKSDSGMIYLMKYESNEWKKIGENAISDGEALFCDFSFSESGIPYVVYTDAAHAHRVTVMQYFTDEWRSVGEKGLSSGMAAYTCIDCYNNEPFIAFRDTAAGAKLKVMKYEY